MAVVPNEHSSSLIPLGDILAYHSGRDPARAAISMGDRSISRLELDARANKRARLLQGFGVRHGDLVTVALANGIEFYETTFALWKLGAVPNIVSSKLPDAELGAILALVDPKIVIGCSQARASGRTVLAPDQLINEEFSAEALPTVVSPHWKAMTSGGSTGRPKVIVDHAPGAFDPKSPALLQAIDDVILNPGPLYHNAPFIGTHWGLFVGAHIIEMGKFDSLNALKLISQYRVQWVNLVPTMMNRMWRLPEEEKRAADMSSLRVVFHMAAPCPAWLKQGWIDWVGPQKLFELYGGTERQGATVISGEEWLRKKGSVGRIQPGSAIRILREDQTECAAGEMGEIFFLPDGGQNTTYHYMGAQSKAAGSWESIGDLGWLDEDGYLYISDRRTDLILSGGANIYPAEVEAAIEAHEGVLSCAVIGLPSDDLGQCVHAIVQVNEMGPTSDELLGFLREKLALYKVPRTIELVDHPLRDEAGKVRRSALRDQRLKG